MLFFNKKKHSKNNEQYLEHLKEKDEEIKKLNKELYDSKLENQELKLNIKQLEDKNTELYNDNRRIVGELITVNKEKSEDDSEIKDTNCSTNNTEILIDIEESEFTDDIEELFNGVLNDFDTEPKDMLDMRIAEAENATLKIEKERLLEQIESLTKEKSSVEKLLEEANKILDDTKTKNYILVKDNEKTNDKLKEIKEERKKLKYKLRYANSKIERLENKVKELKEQLKNK